jgi:hypothetical protein
MREPGREAQNAAIKKSSERDLGSKELLFLDTLTFPD